MSALPPATSVLALLASLLLPACAHDHAPPQKATHMSATDAPLATRDAAALINATLDLVINSSAPGDISQERLREALDVPVQVFGPATYYGAGGPLTRDWSYSVEVDQAGMHGPRFSLSFLPRTPSAVPDAGPICAVDFDAVAARLNTAGFKQETTRGEHGRIVDEKFHRAGSVVTVLTRGESDAGVDAVRHVCVTSIIFG